MSKLYDKYLYLKKNNPNKNTLYLFKSGIFLIFLDQDAIVASQVLGLKLSHLTEKILKCGFPASSLDKYSNLLKKSNYELQIVDQNDNHIYKCNEFQSNNKIADLLNEISNINTDILSVKEAYDLLEDLKQKATDLKGSVK